MSGVKRVSGFTLITAIFLLVVVAGLSVYMINLRSVQQATVVFGLQGARAMQAARTGLEWGVFEAIKNNNCPLTTPFNTSGAGQLDGFNITVNCQLSSHIEGGTTVTTYQLISSAETGIFGTLDYVFRRLQATVSNQPP